MDYLTARHLVVSQTIVTDPRSDALLHRLQQGQPPIPGQITSLLLALKVIDEQTRGATEFDRVLASALYRLAYDSRQEFERGRRQGVDWPPLLDEDLGRIAAGVTSIFTGT